VDGAVAVAVEVAVAVAFGKRPPGRPNHTWLRTIELDLRPLNNEHWSFLHVEEGSLSRTLAFDCGHGYSPEECAIKRERYAFEWQMNLC